ncbi:MAG: Glutamyl-tRNA synthetase [Candidatus Beckwithbacteria bacterium GW2011_GWA2_43_10]|uniref:Glutamate--tRNA ligase n=1 Tax=Candidatus Beckwithbacteria bacterium GW2011_GWA2_43_10 TaxID=1618369 RepID=A0A0G1C012_9BACT|nr:MAG: Glutamyl-tRNA synthetase [Candidatus Beckwithbacteria bacterium GW2011_GWA2_43_10]
MVRVRFAPSPTGIPHIGNTRTALFNYLFARHHQGKFILRIEDTDRARLVPGSLEKILEILKIVGIQWDEGPYIQSTGHGYDGYCRQLSTSKVESLKKPFVIRLKVPQTGTTGWEDLIQKKIVFKNQLLDDQVLLKSDGFPTYHLAVVVDDYLMKISHILRGSEWISSTPKHILLYRAFGWPVPQIGHFSVILGPDKAKLSKRHGAKSVLDYCQEGYLPQALTIFMAYLGWSYQDNSKILSLDELIKLFDIKALNQTNAIFDIKKLDYFNAKLIRQLAVDKLLQLIKPFLKFKLPEKKLIKIIPLIQERLVKLGDFNDLIEYFALRPKPDTKALLRESKMSVIETKKYLQQVSQAVDSSSDWSTAILEEKLHDLQTKLGLKPRPAFMTIRLAVTGRSATPPLFDVLNILGKNEVVKRLTYVQKTLE